MECNRLVVVAMAMVLFVVQRLKSKMTITNRNGPQIEESEDSDKYHEALYVLSDELEEEKRKGNFGPMPKLSAEEENSIFLAKHLICPGCHAIAFQFHKAFTIAHRYQNKRLLTEPELVDIVGMYYKLIRTHCVLQLK